ncbi:MAG: hypothetical protein ACO3A2_06615 [Bdellovibrionia bacterium]
MINRTLGWIFCLLWIAPFFGLGSSYAQESKKEPRVIYPKKTEIDFDGMSIEGELRKPGEFYFQHKPEEKMDSLVKRRKNFHREMLRDAMLSQ